MPFLLRDEHRGRRWHVRHELARGERGIVRTYVLELEGPDGPLELSRKARAFDRLEAIQLVDELLDRLERAAAEGRIKAASGTPPKPPPKKRRKRGHSDE